MPSHFVRAIAAALALGGPYIAYAQAYPTRPVTMVMPYAAGGPGDTVTRIFAQAMTKTLGQSVIVENPSGAGGTIGSNRIAKSKPDGYNLLMIHISHATSLALYKQLPYHPVNDFDPIGLVAEVPMTFVARKDFPPKDLDEFLTYIKANKKKVTYGNAGIGSASHLCGLLFMSAMQTELTTVPYKGTGPAMNDLMGGQFDFMCDQTTNTVPPIRSGKIKVYAVASKGRLAALPDTPALSQSGLPGFEISIAYGVYAPKGLARPVTDKLVAALQEAVKDAAVRTRLADLGAESVSPERARPDALRAHLKAEIDKFGPVIRQAGVFAD
jgi:tripartite-type tricarboxylate transporter receptor subunit TctC